MNEAWLMALPPALAPQRRVIQGLLDLARGDARIRLVAIGCSLGRGNADALSDVDALVGTADGDWRAWLPDIDAGLRRIGPILDMHSQELPGGPGGPLRHTFIEYADGVQVYLAVSPAPAHRAHGLNWIVLHDPDGRVSGEPEGLGATRDQIRSWMFGVLVRLSAATKYVTRGSLWEADATLDAARMDLWRLWAVRVGAPDPQFGLTAVLDVPGAPLPAGIERTIAALDRDSIVLAALACIDLLSEVWAEVGEREPLPPLFARVRAQLADLRSSRRG